MTQRTISIDSHAHVFPGSFKGVLSQLRKRSRRWLRPYTRAIHELQLYSRLLPETARRPFEELTSLGPVATLVLEATVQDLKEEMRMAGVKGALLIAHPPLAFNEFILSVTEGNPGLYAAVNIPPGTPRAAVELKRFIDKGARALKIHRAADGEPLDSPHYASLLETADERQLPVILHTGCFHSHTFFKNPELGAIEGFLPWFSRYPHVRFILAHMNGHEPRLALDIAEDHANLFVDTSWQPTELIGEAVRRLGAERVLFGSDWPIVGGNMRVGKARIAECVTKGTLKPAEAEFVLGKNAMRLFRIENYAD
jgi:predicted TIM-barrel fold metal-dependent hydrolase